MSVRRAILIGAGGHAGVVADALAAVGTPVAGLVTPDATLHGTKRHGLHVLGDDDSILGFSPEEVVLVNAIGSVHDTTSRRNATQISGLRVSHLGASERSAFAWGAHG